MSTKILAAVSGGADSMCMLSLLVSQGEDVVAAHFNHKIRGAESDRDAEFVRSYCEQRRIPLICGEAEEPLNSEEQARTARYAFLQRAAEESGCGRIATAHNMDDNAETVLLNLTRGTGPLGLCGIPPQRENIIRPLLSMTRSEIEAYNIEHGIPWVEDSTNASDDYSRNLIRHRVLPVLKELNPRVVEAIYRTSQILREDEEYFETGNDRALRAREIRRSCPRPLSYEQVEAVLNLGEGYKQLDLPGVRVVKDRGKLFFTPESREYEVRIEKGIVNNQLINSCIKSDSIKGELRVTTRQPGDRLRVAGRNCTKTLKSLFLEADMTQAERDAVPIIRDDEGILWVYGLALAERAKASEGDEAYIITVTEKRSHAQ